MRSSLVSAALAGVLVTGCVLPAAERVPGVAAEPGSAGAASCADPDPGDVGNCTGDACEATLADNQLDPGTVAVDCESVYWVSYEPAHGAIRKVSKAGGEIVTLADEQGGPVDLAVDDTHVYWVNSDAGTIAKIPTAGGEPTLLAIEQSSPSGIAIDATHVYWVNPTEGSVMRVEKSGDAMQTLATDEDQPELVVVAGEYLYWSPGVSGSNDPVIRRMRKDGTTKPEFFAANWYFADLATDATSLFFITHGQGSTLTQIDLEGGNPTDLDDADAWQGTSVAVDDTHVYFSANSRGGEGPAFIARVRKDPTKPATVLAEGAKPVALALDATRIYWSDEAGDIRSRLK